MQIIAIMMVFILYVSVAVVTCIVMGPFLLFDKTKKFAKDTIYLMVVSPIEFSVRALIYICLLPGRFYRKIKSLF